MTTGTVATNNTTSVKRSSTVPPPPDVKAAHASKVGNTRKTAAIMIQNRRGGLATAAKHCETKCEHNMQHIHMGAQLKTGLP